MDFPKFIDSLDSLWFFSNVLSSTTLQSCDSGHASGEQTVPEEPENQNLGKKCCLSGEVEPPVLHLESVDLKNPEEKIKSRRTRRRSKRILHEWRNMGSSGYHYFFFGGQLDDMKMPPFEDGKAMKKHLKSWAHAVACTVR